MSLALAIALVGMTSIAVAALLLPLLLGGAAPASRDAYNLAVYRDQLAEIERDIGRFVLTAEQAQAARAEIGRRILALGQPDHRVLVRPKPIAAAVIAILALPVAALLIYAELGAPLLPDQPFAERAGAQAPPAAAAADHIDMRTALATLRAHLKASPDDLTGWLLLARTDVGLGQYQAGAEAYRRAADLSGHRADVMGDWGEAQVLAAGGTVTPAAAAAFQAALGDPAAAPRSRYYLALAQQQHGEVKGAIAAWQALQRDSPADAAWLPVVKQRIAEAEATLAGGASTGSATIPSAATVAAAEQATAGASPVQRRAMIGAMVARLAAQLQQQPDDPDGWARLGRSYMVLGEAAKARDAYARALKLKPGDAALKQALAEATGAAAQSAPAPAK